MRDNTVSDNSIAFLGPDQVNWVCKPFHELHPEELYQALRLRSEVFVVEQQCPYLDEDNRDQQAWHLFGWIDHTLAAYVRILPPGLAFSELSIGRVVSSPRVRRQGIGRPLMLKAIEIAWQVFGKQSIHIGAQLYLKDFYASVGFAPLSDIYLEDNIQHIEMMLII